MQIRLLFIFFFFVNLTSFSQNEWEWLNPKPMGNTLLDIEFVDDKTGFILTNGTVFKTNNTGETWNKHYTITNGVDIDFNQNTGLISAYSSTIYLSTDKGEVWEKKTVSTTLTNLHTANVISDKELAVASTNMIFISNDGGKNWKSLPTPSTLITKIFFFNTETGLVFTNNGQIYKTTNAGQQWKLVNSVNFSPSNYVQVHFVNQKVGYLSRQHGAVLKTTDGGDTWTLIQPSTDLFYSFSFLDENTGFMAGSDGVIFSTSDGAKTLDWKGFQSGRIYNTTMLGIYFINSNVGFAVGARGMINKTVDGGKTWKQYGITYDNINKVAFPSQDTGYFLTYKKIYKSGDSGNNWVENYDFNEPIIHSHFFSKDKIIITTSSKIYKTQNGGTNWKTIIPNSTVFPILLISSMCFIDENNGFLGGTIKGFEPFVATTKDGGETWNYLLKSNSSIYGFQFFDTKNALVLLNGDLYQSTDSGANWKKTYEIYGDLTQIEIVSDSIAYISGEFNTVLKTTNKGKTWQEQKTAYDHLKSICFINPNVGFASGEYGNFYQTSNGGNTWKNYFLGSRFYSLDANSTLIVGAGEYGVVQRGKFTVDEFGASTTAAEAISSSEATLTGWLFTNGTEITNIKFEYGINRTNLTKISSPIPTIPSFNSDSPKLTVRNLSPNTNYIYFISYDYKGKHYETFQMTFKTPPEIDITRFSTLNLGSKQTSLVATFTSRNKGITEIIFEYGNSNSLSQKSVPRPDTVKAKTQANIETEIKGLTPNTDYIARIRAKSNGQIYYSDTLRFRTQSSYILQMQDPEPSNLSIRLKGMVYAPDDSVKNMRFEYDTTRFFSNPKIAVITPNFTVSNRYYGFSSQLSNLDSTKIYYARFRAKVANEELTGPIQFFTLQKKIIILPLEATLTPPNQVTLNSMVYPAGKLFYNIKFLFGENGQLTDSVNAIPSSAYGYGTIRPQAIIKTLKPNTLYTARIKGTAENKTFLSDKFTFYNGVVTSIEENLNSEITIFPNPTTGIVNIIANEKMMGYEVLRTDGTLLREKQSNAEKIDISALQSGVYILRIFFQQYAKSFKIIKF